MESEIRIIRDQATRQELAGIAAGMEWEFVKAVVDVARGVMAIGGEMHVDEETALLEDGSTQGDLWGINLYPETKGEDWLEYDSMINIRPSQGNRSRDVEDGGVRMQIREVVERLIAL
ncbi:MAG: hypothetical protein RL141_471 [Candidatus Parcubacteria bacterium]|jgi:hypothetical protein